jgi:PKD repeat protein
MKLITNKLKWGPALAVLLLLLCLVGVAAADPYVGGIPLTTVQSGTVSGGVYVDASLDDFGPQDVAKTFASIPDVSDIVWARLYVVVYCGHMENNYQGTATITFDGNGDDIYETTLGTEDLDVEYTWPGKQYPEDSGNYGTGPVIINDHMNRVTSDYQMWYDVTSLISSQTPKARVVSTKVDPSFDGRIKMITLIVAYNDGDSDQVYYWVNQGHDTDTKEYTGTYNGPAEFDLTAISGTVESATLTVNHLASSDGSYAWYGTPIDTDPATGNFQGDYFGYNIWDLTDDTSFGDIYDLTYDRTDNYYKIALAVLAVKKAPSYVKPVVDFTATPLSGPTPLTVQFTDLSSGPPTSWIWYYRLGSGSWIQFSTEKNPSYTFTTTGTYGIRLTASNPAGSTTLTKSSYITVTAAANPDLTITDIRPVASTPFARETNTVKITVKNIGGSASPATTLNLVASDGFTATGVAVPALASNGETEISIVDTTVRDLAGGSLTYTGTVDPDNLVTESNEANNVAPFTYTVAYNGYKGKRYWEGGSDITTKLTYDLNGDIVYFTQPESAYRGVGWTTRTETWTAANLPIPAGATVEKAWLLFSYNWDQTPGGYPNLVTTFNGNPISLGTPYRDWSNFGGYADYEYGLYPAYDVTSIFNVNGDNTLVTTPGTGNANALYPSTIAVIYSDASKTRKQIFINEEIDLLGVSQTSYGTTLEEATAYAHFTDMTIDIGSIQSAYWHSFATNAGPAEGNIFFNGNSLGTNVFTGSPSTAGAKVFDVKSYLTANDNEAAVQGTESGGMGVIQQILVVEYEATPPTIELTLGNTGVTLDNMVPGQDATNSTTVNVVASNGNIWSVSAKDGKTTNKGYMVSGSTPLANPFQLGNDGNAFQPMTSEYTSFMSGDSMGLFSAIASLKQPIDSGDAPGDYAITITFTGSCS